MMELKQKTFREWFIENHADVATDIVEHGANCGYYGLIYYCDLQKLWDKYQKEIWTMFNEEAEQVGMPTLLYLNDLFQRVSGEPYADELDEVGHALVLWAAEHVAYQLSSIYL